MLNSLKKSLRWCSLSVMMISCSDDNKNEVPPPPQVATPLVGSAAPAERPLLVVFGDSLATGVLANTHLGQAFDTSIGQQLGKLLSQGATDKEEAQKILSNPELAASTTTAPYGIRAAIAATRQLKPEDIDVVSLARFGAKAEDMEEMQSDLNAQLAPSQGRLPQYIFIMLGGNDFCSEETPADFRTRYQERVMAVHDQYPNAHYIIAPVPPVDQLAAIDFDYGPAVPGLGGSSLSCQSLRQRSCSMIYRPDAAQRIKEINQAVSDATAALTATGARVDFAGEVSQWPIQAEQLAIDCFHPSEKGQEAIGQYVGRAIKL